MADTADWYDTVNTWDASDDFYLGLVLPEASVLDVGCGTGSLLAAARDAGHTGRLVGLDPDEGMLAVGPTWSGCSGTPPRRAGTGSSSWP